MFTLLDIIICPLSTIYCKVREHVPFAGMNRVCNYFRVTSQTMSVHIVQCPIPISRDKVALCADCFPGSTSCNLRGAPNAQSLLVHIASKYIL